MISATRYMGKSILDLSGQPVLTLAQTSQMNIKKQMGGLGRPLGIGDMPLKWIIGVQVFPCSLGLLGHEVNGFPLRVPGVPS